MENTKSFLYKLYDISSRVQQLRSTEITLHADTKLNTVALSTLYVISKNPDKNMSEISTIMGVTKGAISQMALKLEKKGFIQKNRSEHNEKNYFITLTPKGTQALDEYCLLHDKLYHGMSEVLSHYRKEDLDTIWRFLCETNEFIDNFNENIAFESKDSSNQNSNCDTEFLNVRR